MAFIKAHIGTRLAAVESQERHLIVAALLKQGALTAKLNEGSSERMRRLCSVQERRLQLDRYVGVLKVAQLNIKTALNPDKQKFAPGSTDVPITNIDRLLRRRSDARLWQDTCAARLLQPNPGSLDYLLDAFAALGRGEKRPSGHTTMTSATAKLDAIKRERKERKRDAAKAKRAAARLHLQSKTEVSIGTSGAEFEVMGKAGHSGKSAFFKTLPPPGAVKVGRDLQDVYAEHGVAGAAAAKQSIVIVDAIRDGVSPGRLQLTSSSSINQAALSVLRAMMKRGLRLAVHGPRGHTPVVVLVVDAVAHDSPLRAIATSARGKAMASAEFQQASAGVRVSAGRGWRAWRQCGAGLASVATRTHFARACECYADPSGLPPHSWRPCPSPLTSAPVPSPPLPTRPPTLTLAAQLM